MELRHNTYFAVLYIPKSVRHILGKNKFSKTTETSDLRLAEDRADAYVLMWKQEIAKALQTSPDPVIAEALSLRNELNYSSARLEVQETIDDRAREISKEYGAEIFGDEFKAIATGKHAVLQNLLPSWIIYEKKRGLAQKTIDQFEKDVTRIVNLFITSNQLIEKYVTACIENIATRDNLSASSVTRIVSSCRAFFKYLQHIGEVPSDTPNPFKIPSQFRISKKPNSKAVNKAESWIPFDQRDIPLLHSQALDKKDQVLADLILIGAYSGARIEEICSLKCRNVDLKNSCFKIIESKTNASTRTIPIHPFILSRVTQLLDKSDDGYVLPGLTNNKYGDRSNAIGKRFGRLKNKMEFSSGHVFHSIRKTFTTILENAKVLENIAADILGHEKPRETYGIYSGGTHLDTMREAIEKVSYEIDPNRIFVNLNSSHIQKKPT